jgi:peptidoglycan/LPS O-acetylase OafA/YrhL
MSTGNRVPSLDGLRAASITLVLLSHSFNQSSGSWPQSLRVIVRNGPLGVSVFFVISGYLITMLLVREWGATGKIDLQKFYVRRAFRIIPACYAYLGVVLLLMCAGLIFKTFPEWFLCLIFLRNYAVALGLGSGQDSFTAHCWSLAVEEQFYLFSPACLAVFGPRRCVWLAAGLIIASPVSRVLTYLALPGDRMPLVWMTHTRMDTIMFGCLAALLCGSGALRAGVRRAADARLPWFAIFFVIVISPLLTMRFRGVYLFLFRFSLEGACITLVMLWLIDRPASFAGRLMNKRAVVHLGVISYSFYLWQQLFCGLGLPWSIAPTLLMAEGSYRFIEQPFLRARERFLSRGGGRWRPLLMTSGFAETQAGING